MKTKAYLFGPFVGNLSWEFYRFAPFAIHMKKENPDTTLIVLTRQWRFDLYGKYADILVPLRIPDDIDLTRDCFKLESLMTKDYNRIARMFRSKYKKRYQIVEHYYPDISSWRYKVKWQFPRNEMDYDFKPRERNKEIAKKRGIIDHFIVDNQSIDYCKLPDVHNSMDLFCRITNFTNDYDSTFLGTMIECIKLCKAVIGNLDNVIPHLSLLLKKPVISINNILPLDSIRLLNPLNTPIIFSNSIEEGIEEYDNYI